MDIQISNESFSTLDAIIDLADRNSTTLGFLPKAAFEEASRKKRILTALNSSNELQGYLYYSIAPTKMEVSIVHLCVQESARGKGVSRKLFEALKRYTEKDGYRRIRVHCRRDYEYATKMWLNLGFIAVGEKPGRSKEGSILTIWSFDYGIPSLFSYNNNETNRHRVAIDANIFFELQKVSAIDTTSHALLADWLVEHIELCITSELNNEINRATTAEKRRLGHQFANTFKTLQGNDEEFQSAKKKLLQIYKNKQTESFLSDIRQLARVVASNTYFFITQDEELLKKSDEVFDKLNVRIIRPADFIIQQDSLIREVEYQPRRLGGSRINVAKDDSYQTDQIAKSFLDPSGEKKSQFIAKWQSLRSNPHQIDVSVVREDDNNLLALFAYDHTKPDIFSVPLFRIIDSPISSTLAHYLISRTIRDSLAHQCELTVITDNYLSETILGLLPRHGFFQTEDKLTWEKRNIPLIGQIEDILKTSSVDNLFSNYSNNITLPEKLALEQALWPAKFTDLDIPTFIVSIKPVWAMNLFDPELGRQEMFGANPTLIFNTENVYYRSHRPSVLTAPARVLWYVNHSDNYTNIQAIRACSYIDEVEIDLPETLYKKYRRLGVYERKNVMDVAKHKVDQPIMAFKFSRTENFDHPITRQELRTLWKNRLGKNFHNQAPLKIDNEMFLSIYEIGFPESRTRITNV